MRFQMMAMHVSAAVLACGASVHAAEVDVTNGNGTIDNQLLNSYGGLSSDNFQTASSDDVSLWLRARMQSQQAVINSNDHFEIQPDDLTTNSDEFRIDFQFTPKDGDALASTSPVSDGGQFNNYQLMLQFDSDPTSGVNYGTATPKYVVFDDDDNNGQYVKSPNGDIDDRDDDTTNSPNTDSAWETNDDKEELTQDASWDDGDSLVINGVAERNGEVDFVLNTSSDRDSENLSEWVVVNSWRPEWVPGGNFSTPEDPGLYNVKLSVFNEAGTTELASLESTVEVVPEPASIALLGLGGLALLSRRRRN